MPVEKHKHLRYEDRCVIEDGIRDGLSAREIARRLGVHPTTVTREVLANRTVKVPRRKQMSASKRCTKYRECQKYEDLCAPCISTGQHACRRCKAIKCFDACPDFELRMCDTVAGWPYVCTCYNLDRDYCMFPKCRYRAREADEASRGRRRGSREGISLDERELGAMLDVVRPLVRQGHSLEAIWLAHGDELPVGVRTFYNYIENGVVDIASLELPRKVRYRKRRKKKEPARDRVDRAGREYSDFEALGADDRARAAQVDTVVGRASNAQRILSIYLPVPRFQLYLLLADGGADRVVSALDWVEMCLGGSAAFSDALGVILADRGTEFDDWAGIERSATEPGSRRCRLFYCDPMQPAQKAGCERNHEELRRVLPKGRSDFDELTAFDVATLCSHVNSYPRRGLGGACPYDIASLTLPEGALDMLGVERVPNDEIVLKPELLSHAVEL